jgi:hypothetical protein
MRPPPKCTTPGQGYTWRGSGRWRRLLCSQAFDVAAFRMTAAGVPLKDCFMVSAIASTLYEAAAFPGPSLDRRRIACLYQDPPIIWAQHFTHLINSLHGALHCMLAVLKTERQTVSAPRCLPSWGCYPFHHAFRATTESPDASSGDRKRLRPPFRSLKSARSQHIVSRGARQAHRGEWGSAGPDQPFERSRVKLEFSLTTGAGIAFQRRGQPG